jgi:hypothetical protein
LRLIWLKFASIFFVIPLTLRATSVFFGCTSFRVFASWFCCFYASTGLSIFVPFGASCWISSTIGVGFTGIVSGDGISSTLMISDGCCSPSSNCTCDLVLTLGFMVPWLASACFGGAMVVNVEHLLSLNGLCDLCGLGSVLLNLYRSLSVLLSQMDSLLPRLCVVWASHEAC